MAAKKFKINLSFSETKQEILSKKCTEKTKISSLLSYVFYEFEDDLPDAGLFSLSYNGVILEPNKTLNDYGINDNRHLIKVLCYVKASNEAKYDNDNNNNNDMSEVIIMDEQEKKLFVQLNKTIQLYARAVLNLRIFPKSLVTYYVSIYVLCFLCYI